jgi:hypothetical protein
MIYWFMTLDDFNIIFSLDLLKKAKIVLMLCFGVILITNKTCLDFTSCYKTLVVGSSKGSNSMISSIVIDKALKRTTKCFW